MKVDDILSEGNNRTDMIKSAMLAALGELDAVYDDARELLASDEFDDANEATEYVLTQFKNQVAGNKIESLKRLNITPSEIDELEDSLFDFIYNGLT